MTVLSVGGVDWRHRRTQSSAFRSRLWPLHTNAMDEEGVLEIGVRLERRDWVRANQAILLKSRAIKVILGLGALSLLASIYLWVANPSRIPWNGFYLPAVFPMLWISTHLVARRNVPRGGQEEIHYVFSDRGVDTTSPTSNWHADWGSIYKVDETREAFLVFRAQNQALLIPKRCLTAEQTGSLRNILESCVPSKLSLQRA
jgi:hypothetical protein